MDYFLAADFRKYLASILFNLVNYCCLDYLILSKHCHSYCQDFITMHENVFNLSNTFNTLFVEYYRKKGARKQFVIDVNPCSYRRQLVHVYVSNSFQSISNGCETENWFLLRPYYISIIQHATSSYVNQIVCRYFTHNFNHQNFG